MRAQCVWPPCVDQLNLKTVKYIYHTEDSQAEALWNNFITLLIASLLYSKSPLLATDVAINVHQI